MIEELQKAKKILVFLSDLKIESCRQVIYIGVAGDKIPCFSICRTEIPFQDIRGKRYISGYGLFHEGTGERIFSSSNFIEVCVQAAQEYAKFRAADLARLA